MASGSILTFRVFSLAAAILLAGMTSVCFGDVNANIAQGIPLPTPAPPSPILSPVPPRVQATEPRPPGSESEYEQLVLPAVPPQFVYVPELGYYVAIETPYDIAYIENEYFMFSNGFWYRTDHYGGALIRLERSMWPSLLTRHTMKDFRRFRDVEFKRYNHDRGHYKGQLHSPAVRNDDRRDLRKVE